MADDAPDQPLHGDSRTDHDTSLVTQETPPAFSIILRDYIRAMRAYKWLASFLKTGFRKGVGEELDRVIKDANEAKAQLDRLGERLETLGSLQEADRDIAEAHSLIDQADLLLRRLRKSTDEIYTIATQPEHLSRSILIGLVSQFETAVSAIVREYFLLVPEALPSQDRIITVDELRRFVTVDEVLAYIIDHKVDDLLRKNLDDWSRFFETRMHIMLQPMVPDWDYFVEAFQRRHIIIHGGGRIDRKYLDVVKPDVVTELFGGSGSVLGKAGRLGPDYLSRAVAQFEIAGVQLIYASWLKLHKDEADKIGASLGDTVYNYLLTAEWHLSLQLAAWAAQQPTLSETFRTITQMNAWLSAKRLGKWEEIRQSASEFAVEEQIPTVRLAHASLFENHDLFFTLLDQYGAELPRLAWEEWPILDEMRADPRFADMKRRYITETDISEIVREAEGALLVSTQETLEVLDNDTVASNVAETPQTPEQAPTDESTSGSNAILQSGQGD